jgi:hypothetical protein
MEPVPTNAEAARAIAARHLSPVELTRACLDRIARIDPALRGFLLVTEERALADARAAEARVMRGEAKGPLDGIPIGHKDPYATAGIRTTGHSRLLAGNVPAPPGTRPWRRGWPRPARCCSASSRPTSSPWAGTPSTCPGRSPTTPGT